MSLSGFKAQNHPQQTGKRGAKSEVDNLETPWDFFQMLDRRFDFTLDACALPHNAKVQGNFYTPEQDGLAQSWAGARVWCNPPYSNIEPWAHKARTSNAELVVMLLPANRTEQGWWQREVEPFRDRGQRLSVEFLPGRLRFLKPGAIRVGADARPPFGCCLVIWS